MSDHGGSYTSRRLVLKDWGSEEEVFEFAAEGRFELIRDESEDIPLGIVRDVLWWITPTIALQYAVDTRSQCSVFALTGTPADDVKGIVESIEQGVHPWTLKELLAAVNDARGPAEVAAAVLRAGMGAPQSFDRKFYKVVRTAIRSHDAEVRSAGVWATSYSRWDKSRDLLETTAEADPEPSIRRDARVILEHYDS
ncbi:MULTISPECIES: hypothetical protein [unclassified Kribbella]|uniref:hypothetical protein n=1 Tax=unclassified Kribbella TaxID=2644121 RepID=UPI003016E23C